MNDSESLAAVAIVGLVVLGIGFLAYLYYRSKETATTPASISRADLKRWGVKVE